MHKSHFPAAIEGSGGGGAAQGFCAAALGCRVVAVGSGGLALWPGKLIDASFPFASSAASFDSVAVVAVDAVAVVAVVAAAVTAVTVHCRAVPAGRWPRGLGAGCWLRLLGRWLDSQAPASVSRWQRGAVARGIPRRAGGQAREEGAAHSLLRFAHAPIYWSHSTLAWGRRGPARRRTMS